MRWKLIRRRLTLTAPRVAVRNHLPAPLRWLAMAVLLGVAAALGLWAFEAGRRLTGSGAAEREELQRLRGEVAALRAERERSQSAVDVSSSLITAEKSAQDVLAARVKALEDENRSLRNDLGFFERLIPASGDAVVAVRGLHAETIAGGAQLKWQMVVIQPSRRAGDFQGRLELVATGTLDGKPWTASLPAGGQPLAFKLYRRAEGVADLPAGAVVRSLTVRISEGGVVRATHSLKL